MKNPLRFEDPLDNTMPMWQAVPIAVAVVGLIVWAFWESSQRESATLFWATVALCVALVPPMVSGWNKGRRRLDLLKREVKRRNICLTRSRLKSVLPSRRRPCCAHL